MDRNEQLALEYLKILAEKNLLDFYRVGSQGVQILISGDPWQVRSLEQNVKLLHATYNKILELVRSSEEASAKKD